MTKYDIYEHTNTKITKEVKQGFNWPGLFFGCFWYWYKGMVGKGFLFFFIALATGWITLYIAPLIMWTVIGFKANDHYREYLTEKGYKKVKTIDK